VYSAWFARQVSLVSAHESANLDVTSQEIKTCSLVIDLPSAARRADPFRFFAVFLWQPPARVSVLQPKELEARTHWAPLRGPLPWQAIPLELTAVSRLTQTRCLRSALQDLYSPIPRLDPE
jgi:hypothetical protein